MEEQDHCIKLLTYNHCERETNQSYNGILILVKTITESLLQFFEDVNTFF